MSEPLSQIVSVLQESILSALRSSPGFSNGHAVLLDSLSLSGKSVAISAVVGISSPSWNGTLGIQFPEDTFRTLFSQPSDGLSTEGRLERLMERILAEARSRLEHSPTPLQFALPNLLIGKSLESMGAPKSGSRQSLEFRSSSGSFWGIVEILARTEDPIPRASEHGSPKNWTADALLEFVKAVRKTLEVQFATRIEIGPPFKKTGDSFLFDVGSMIGVVDGEFSGYFGMFYEKATFLGLMGALLGDEFTELNSEIEDGASEITNICFGVAKKVLNEQGHAIRMALPSLVRGNGISSASSSSHRTTIAVPLSTPRGKFWIEFGYSGGPA